MAIRTGGNPSKGAGSSNAKRWIAALAWVCMVLLVMGLGGLGCKKKEQATGMQPSEQATGQQATGQQPGEQPAGQQATGQQPGEQVESLSDGDIAAVARAANNGEIESSMVANTQAKDPEVREFAKRMIAEHSAAIQRLQSILDTRKIGATENQLSRQVTGEASSAINTIRPLTGESFDRAYMDAQVMLHQRVLNLLETKLVPQARDPQLKSDLQTMRTIVADHLEHARRIQRKLGEGGGSSGQEGATGAGQPQS